MVVWGVKSNTSPWFIFDNHNHSLTISFHSVQTHKLYEERILGLFYVLKKHRSCGTERGKESTLFKEENADR